MKYHIITYGCQRNNNDSERIAAFWENRDYKPASNLNGADLVVVNACSVRQSAIDRIFGKIEQFKKIKNNPPAGGSKLKTILTGCVLTKDKIKFKKLFDEIWDVNEFSDALPKYQSSFKASLPIMTGCNNFCSYCAVPYVRGKETSRHTDEIICEIKNLVERGYKEIWLLGENVNSYRFGFTRLLKTIDKLPGDFWIRFTSPHPKDFSDELIKTMAKCEKITPYLNLPVQSGDNEILKKMKRPYTVEQYKNLVKKIRKQIPDVCLSTDVIVGFPGETKKQFENTVKLFKDMKYDMAYISQYSPRSGTAAFKMKDSVSHDEKEKRDKILTEILKQTALENNKKYLGKIAEVLPEEKRGQFLIGKTKSYKSVKFEGDENLIGNFTKVKIIAALPWGLKAKLL